MTEVPASILFNFTSSKHTRFQVAFCGMHRAQETSNVTYWSLKKAFAGCAWVVQVWALHIVQIPAGLWLDVVYS